MEKRNAVGVIETIGLLGTIAALDTALKTSAVVLTSFLRVQGGRIAFALEGDVSAVIAAVDAASQTASELNVLRGRHVIPSPDKQTREMIGLHDQRGYSQFLRTRTQKKLEFPYKKGKREQRCHDFELKNLKTTELRRVLRDCNDGIYEGREISRMRKEQLLEALRSIRKDG